MTDSTLRDDIRTDLRGLFTGDRTIGDSFPAPLVFVMVNAWAGLGWAAFAALTVGLGVTGWRIARGRPIAYALAGLAAIGFTALLAVRSGRAESYFLPGIVSAAAWAVIAFGSVLLRNPMAAWMSRFVRRWPLEWYRRRHVRPAYARVTLLWVAYFTGRAAAQWLLYLDGRPELLAVVKVATSWPTIIPLLIVSYVYGNRTLRRLGGPTVDEFVAGVGPPFAGGQRGF